MVRESLSSCSLGASADEPLANLLVEWQSSRSARCLESLVIHVRPLVVQAAVGMLRRRGVRDPEAVEEVISRVLDHLRRLPAAAVGERTVSPFRRGAKRAPDRIERGAAYMIWLTRRRAADVIRRRQRLRRRGRCFSELLDGEKKILRDSPRRPCASSESPTAIDRQRLYAAILHLEPRQHDVVEMLLQGKNQVSIARSLGVCTGTISRLRARAVAQLRRMLTDEIATD